MKKSYLGVDPKRSFLLRSILLYCCLNALCLVLTYDCLASSSPDSSDIRLLYDQSKVLNRAANYDSADVVLNYANELVERAPAVSDELRLGVWKNLGATKARLGQIDSSLLWLNRGLDFVEKYDKPVMQRIDFLINKGVTYYYAKDLEKSIDIYIEASELCRQNNYDKKRSILLNNLGVFYRLGERYEEAIDLYKESYALRLKQNDTLGMANNLFNMAGTYSHLQNYESTLASLSEAELLFKAVGSDADVLLTQLSKGTALIELEKMREALDMLEPLLKEKELPFEKKHEFLFNHAMALLYEHFGEIDKMEKFIERIKEDDIPPKMYIEKVRYLRLKSKLYRKRGDFKSAYNYLKKMNLAQEEYTNVENQKSLKEMETKYLSVEKDHEIDLLEADKRVQEAELESARQRSIGLIIGLALLTLLVSFLFYFINKIRRQNKIISAANEDKEVLLREIHHRVKNNLQVISALLTLQSRYVKDENALDALKKGQDRVESMALIHKDLYQHDNLKGVNTKDYLEKLVGNLVSSYSVNENNVMVKLEIDSIWLDVDTMVPLGLMINELLSNAFKHAFNTHKGGLLRIKLKEESQGLFIQIRDNGEGVSEDAMLKSKSFGYSLIQSFAKKLEADVEFKSEDGLRIDLVIKNYKKVA